MIAYRNGGLEGNWLALYLCIKSIEGKEYSTDKALIAMGVKEQRKTKSAKQSLGEKDLLKIMDRLEEGEIIRKIATEKSLTVEYIESRIKKLKKRYNKFPKELLEDLYINQLKTMPEIGEVIGYKHIMVLNLLKYYKIPVRSIWESRRLRKKFKESDCH